MGITVISDDEGNHSIIGLEDQELPLVLNSLCQLCNEPMDIRPIGKLDEVYVYCKKCHAVNG